MKKLILPINLLLAVLLLASCSSAPPASEGINDRKNRAADYLNYGRQAFQEAQYEQALKFYELAFSLDTAVDYEAGMAIVLNSMAITQSVLGRFEEAKTTLDQAQTLAVRSGERAIILQVAVTRVQGDLASGDTETARKRLDELQPFPATAEGAALDHVLGLLEKDLNRPVEAMAAFDRALATNAKLGLKQEMASNRFMRATLLGREGRWADARAELEAALTLDRLMENTVGIGQDWRALGTVALKLNEPQAAFEAFVRAYRLFHAAGLVMEQRKTLDLLLPVTRSLELSQETTRYQVLLDSLDSTEK